MRYHHRGRRVPFWSYESSVQGKNGCKNCCVKGSRVAQISLPRWGKFPYTFMRMDNEIESPPGSRAGQVIASCSRKTRLTLKVSFSIKEYKWCLRWTSTSPKGVATFLVPYATETGIRFSWRVSLLEIRLYPPLFMRIDLRRSSFLAIGPPQNMVFLKRDKKSEMNCFRQIAAHSSVRQLLV